MMKRSSKIIIGSIISVGLVGVVAAKQFGGPGCGYGPGGMPGGWVSQKIAWQLDLDDAQREDLGELREKMFDGIKTMREQRPSNTDVQAILGEKLDQDKALALLDDRISQARNQAPEMIAAFANFYDALNAEQQAELGAMIERRMEHGTRYHKGRHYGGGDRWGDAQ